MIKKIVILSLTVLVAALLINRWTVSHHHDYEPHFKAKDCFKYKNSWTKEVAGIIAYKKEDYYVVMYYKEADKRYAGPKMGNELPIKWLDMYAVQAECPPEWASKKGHK